MRQLSLSQTVFSRSLLILSHNSLYLFEMLRKIVKTQIFLRQNYRLKVFCSSLFFRFRVYCQWTTGRPLCLYETIAPGI